LAGKIVCPECNAALSYRKKDIGKRAKCANCGAVFVVDPSNPSRGREIAAVPATLRTVKIATRDSRVTNSVATAGFLFSLAGVVLLGVWILGDHFKVAISSGTWVLFLLGFAGGVTVCLWVLGVLMGLVAMARIKSVAFFGTILALACMLTLAGYYYSRDSGGPRQALSQVVEKLGLADTDQGDEP